ncbi:diguanylate cyclase domain-containing protein [Virgibacillus sp. DJP39]|uniref:sensor domain-containing diguanylate cyclase n=1 Tax=Virgibacillus sp. DJP39 TaxID=3409790 RepID=UPI003BB780A0
MDQNQLKENMRNIFFELISDMGTRSYLELLDKVSIQMQEMLQVAYVALYSYNYWEQTYERVTGELHNELKKTPFKDQNIKDCLIETNSTNTSDAIFVKATTLDSKIVLLHAETIPDAFLFIGYQSNDKRFTNKVLEMVQSEFNRLLKIMNENQMRKEQGTKNAFLFDITTKFYSVMSKKNILTEITKGMEKLYPYFHYHILLSQDYEEVQDLPIKTIEYSDDATKRVSTQAFITGEVQLEDRVKEKKTYLYAPLKGKQGVYGVLQIITPNNVEFPEKELEFIAQFATIAGNAIESATLYQYSKHLVEDLKLINDATHALNSNLNIGEITTIVREKIIKACGATQVGFIYTGETQDHMINILSGSTDYFFTSEGEKHADFIFNQVMENKEPQISGDYTKEIADFPFSSVMAIPMLHAGTIHGVIIVIHQDKYAFSFDCFKLMQSLVQHFTLALTNSILNEKLKAVAITDYLTKLYSRNYLEDEIQQHFQIDEKGTLVILDIDDFKRINDTFGHHIGDEVIIQIASIVRAHTGESDVPARWGGEELAIYLSNATISEGVQIATQIRKQAESFTEPKVTLSCGVATWNSTMEVNVKDLFIRADKALYAAKNTGKNCVVKEVPENCDSKPV